MSGGVTLVLNSLRSGGAEKQLLWIASEIVSVGLPCSIFELSSGDRTERIEGMIRVAVARGVRVLRAPSGSRIIESFLRLQRHIKEDNPAVIWSWGLRADGATLLSRPWSAAGKWTRSVRCANVVRGLFSSLAQTVLARCCDGVISNTHAGLASSGTSKISSLRCWVMPNAVLPDPNRGLILPPARPERPVLIMLGNIRIHHKGYDLAAELAQVLISRSFSFELRIAGRPDELAELETICRQRGVQSEVKFYGEVSHPEEFLRGGHLFLLLSRFEGMPNTLLEALNVGLPAIATEVGDLRMLKEKGAPFVLIPTEDVNAAADAVERALAQWSHTREAANKGRSWVQEHFSEEACRIKLRSILAEVLET